jgi:hypothetical protein
VSEKIIVRVPRAALIDDIDGIDARLSEAGISRAARDAGKVRSWHDFRTDEIVFEYTPS